MSRIRKCLISSAIVALGAFVVRSASGQPATSTRPAGKNDYSAFMAGGSAYHRARDDAKAIDAYRQAIAAAPDDKAKTAAEQELASIGTELDSYTSYMSAARAYERSGDDDKAIEAYRQAIVAAPSDATRRAAEDALASTSTIRNSIATSFPKHILQTIKWPFWIVVALAVLAGIFWMAGGLWRRLIDGSRMMIQSDSAEVTGAYAASCVKAVHFDFVQQASSLERVAKLSSTTSAAPTPMTVGAAGSLAVSAVEPVALDKGWLAVLWRFHPNIFSRTSASFALEIRAFKPKDAFGVSIILRKRKKWVGCWGVAGRWQIPATCQDISVALDNALYGAVAAILASLAGKRKP